MRRMGEAEDARSVRPEMANVANAFEPEMPNADHAFGTEMPNNQNEIQPEVYNFEIETWPEMANNGTELQPEVYNFETGPEMAITEFQIETGMTMNIGTHLNRSDLVFEVPCASSTPIQQNTPCQSFTR